MRRTFWLTMGAAGGIMGYRRGAQLGRRVSGARGFSRDVREGMDLYLTRHPGRRALPSVQAQRTPAQARHNNHDVNEKDDR